MSTPPPGLSGGMGIIPSGYPENDRRVSSCMPSVIKQQHQKKSKKRKQK